MSMCSILSSFKQIKPPPCNWPPPHPCPASLSSWIIQSYLYPVCTPSSHSVPSAVKSGSLASLLLPLKPLCQGHSNFLIMKSERHFSVPAYRPPSSPAGCLDVERPTPTSGSSFCVCNSSQPQLSSCPSLPATLRRPQALFCALPQRASSGSGAHSALSEAGH